MGRQNKLDKLDEETRSLVLDMKYKQRKTLKEIEADLKKDGIDVSYQSIRRFIKRYDFVAKALELDGLSITDASLIEQIQKLQQIANGVLFETFTEVNTVSFDPGRAEFLKDLINTTSVAARSIASVSKAKQSINIGQRSFIKLLLNGLKRGHQQYLREHHLSKDTNLLHYIVPVMKAMDAALREAGIEIIHSSDIDSLNDDGFFDDRDDIYLLQHYAGKLIDDLEAIGGKDLLEEPTIKEDVGYLKEFSQKVKKNLSKGGGNKDGERESVGRAKEFNRSCREDLKAG